MSPVCTLLFFKSGLIMKSNRYGPWYKATEELNGCSTSTVPAEVHSVISGLGMGGENQYSNHWYTSLQFND